MNINSHSTISESPSCLRISRCGLVASTTIGIISILIPYGVSRMLPLLSSACNVHTSYRKPNGTAIHKDKVERAALNPNPMCPPVSACMCTLHIVHVPVVCIPFLHGRESLAGWLNRAGRSCPAVFWDESRFLIKVRASMMIAQSKP